MADEVRYRRMNHALHGSQFGDPDKVGREGGV